MTWSLPSSRLIVSDVLDAVPSVQVDGGVAAETIERCAEAGADNVRFCSVDAVWTLENLLGPAGAGDSPCPRVS